MAEDIVVKVRDNGPYLLDASVKILDADGNVLVQEGKTIALCRCGQSQSKPFCDGGHRGAGFESAPRATT